MASLPQVSTPLARIDLTKLDFNGIKNEIRSIIENDTRYQNIFSSFFDGDVGVMLIDLFAQIAHLNNLRIDFTANELSWPNAEEEDTILRFLPLIDYRLKSVQGSTTECLATVTSEPGGVSTFPVFIPGRTPLTPLNTNGNESAAEILASPTNYTGSIRIPAETRNVPITIYAGLTERADLTVTQASNYTFKVNRPNVIDDSIQIFLNDGGDFVLLDRLETFIAPLNDYPSYTVRFDFEGQPTIIFGNKFFGGAFDGIIDNQPETYKQLVMFYRYLTDEGGSVTNYPAGSVSENIEVFVPSLDRNVTVSLINQTAGTGGTDILSVDQVRRIAPLTVRTADKAVTNEDVQIFLSQNSLVKDSDVVTPSEQPTFNIPIFYAYLYIAPNRSVTDFIPITTTPAANQLPNAITGESDDSYNERFKLALENFYNITGTEQPALLTSEFDDDGVTIITDFNDRLRLVVNNDDIVSGFVDITLTEGADRPIDDIVDEINSNFDFNLAGFDNDGFLKFESNVLGDGSYILLSGNNDDAIDNDILEETYQTLGFELGGFAAGSVATGEASQILSELDNKTILGIEYMFKRIAATPFRIEANVFHSENANPVQVDIDVRSALNARFSYAASTLGRIIRLSEIIKTIMDVTDVDYVEVTNPVSDLVPSSNQIYFLLDDFIIDNIPESYPSVPERYQIDLTMIRGTA